jgi:hypothetical protein
MEAENYNNLSAASRPSIVVEIFEFLYYSEILFLCGASLGIRLVKNIYIARVGVGDLFPFLFDRREMEQGRRTVLLQN